MKDLDRRGRRHPLALAAALLPLVLAAPSCRDAVGGGGSPLLWRVALEARDQQSTVTPATDGTRVYAVAAGVIALDAESGALLWRAHLERYNPMNVVVRDGRVFAVEAVALALDPATGRELWRFAPDANGALGFSAADERALYFGTDSHRVYALDVATGQPLWSTDVGPDWAFRGTVHGVSVSGDTVYAGVEQYNAANGYVASGWIFALDRATGRVLWSWRNGTGADYHNVASAPTVAGRLLLASDLLGNAFFAVDRFTGREVWRVNGEPGHFGPQQAPVVVGGSAYVASNDTWAYAVDAQTGATLWKRKMPASNDAFAVCGNSMFVGWLGLSMLDLSTGRVRYQTAQETGEFPTSGFATDGQRAFVLGNRAAYAYSCG
jgi:outer membrane protein assembly factor BamB